MKIRYKKWLMTIFKQLLNTNKLINHMIVYLMRQGKVFKTLTEKHAQTTHC